jgi:hypothetical protein
MSGTRSLGTASRISLNQVKPKFVPEYVCIIEFEGNFIGRAVGMSTAERIIWGALGLLSFIVLIVWLRWEGPRGDQKKDEPPELPMEGEEKHKAETVD